MKINLAISSTITESVQKVIVVGIKTAKQLEGKVAQRVIVLDGVTCIIDVHRTYANLIISGSDAIFLFRPRAGNEPLYPMYEDNTAALIYNAGLWESDPELPLADNYESDLQYGNIDWKSLPDTDGAVTILSWMGPPGRTLAFDPEQSIDGLTVPDISFGETNFFTVFRGNIYQNGSLVYTVPQLPVLTELQAYGSGQTYFITDGGPVQKFPDVEPKVLGAALQGNVLVCIVNNHYEGVIGFWEEVWINTSEGWSVISREFAGRPTECWFFNGSGTKATQGLKEYTIDAETKTVSLSTETNTSLSVRYVSDGEDHSADYSGTTKVWSDYKGDTRVFATITAEGGRRFTYDEENNITVVDAPIYAYGTNPGSTGASIGYANGAYTLNLVTTDACCREQVQWSISGSGSITQQGVVSGVCGVSVITGSLCGVSASTEVKGSGTWVTIAYSLVMCSHDGSNYSPCTHTPCPTSCIDECCTRDWAGGTATITVTEPADTTNATSYVTSQWRKGNIRWIVYTNYAGNPSLPMSSNTTPPPIPDSWTDDEGPVAIVSETREWWCTSLVRGY